MENLPWYKSAILRQQIVQMLVAATALIGVNTETIDLDATVASIFAGIAAVIAIWTFITRLVKPAPNLTAAAQNKEDQLRASGQLPPQRGFFRPSGAVLAFVISALAALAVGTMSGCAANPHRTAQTAEQEADALYGELVIAKEQGARILQDETVSDQVKRPIAEAIVKAKPVTDGFQDALILYSDVKIAVAAGTTSAEELAIVNRDLAGWIARAQPLLSQLAAAIAGARK